MTMQYTRIARGAAALLPALFLAAACGPAPKAESPKDAKQKDESVGQEAVAQGGVTSLTETVQGSGTEAAINGPLRFEQVDPQSPV
jgi:hypothetical protein